jgi:hypothetical protein
MAKRKVRSQTDSLTPNHGKLGFDLIPLRAGGVRHAIGKLSTRAKTSVQTSSQAEVYTRSYEPAKKVTGVPTLAISWLPLRNLGTKSHSDATLAGRCRVYYMGEGGGFPRVRAMVSIVSRRLFMARSNTKGAPTLH